jgi:large subunit ribosomal protein L16
MQLQPKKVKYKKIRKGRLKHLTLKSTLLKRGFFGIKAVHAGFISSKNIESARQSISRKTKRKGKLWINIFPAIPITSKSVGVRMGKGKGSIHNWSSKIKPGTILFEICGVSLKTAQEAFKTGSAKLPVKTQFYTIPNLKFSIYK